MNSHSIYSKFWNGILLCIVPFCIAFSIFSIAVMCVVYGKGIYYVEIDVLNIPEMANMTKEAIIQNYDALITYLSPFYNKPLHFPTLEMSEKGRVHFVDVKNIIVAIQYAMYISIFISFIGGVYLIRKQKEKFLFYAAILTIVFPIVLILPIAINFEKSFVFFHELLFQNDYWLFDPETDPIIRMLPEQFFMHAACIILLLILFGSACCYCLYRFFMRKRGVHAGSRNAATEK
ncbi:TIGR01906 family membrane protein [Bacillus multifaciens]|uniref:lipoprotein intramolecular transacylase Lit n=1 Tax=Bacillus multifaciens TaxID=3068506 RepID=UPI0027426F32|nr:TIGR01906 family membrane protein [Bacillus sp. WLY-B-L8]MDP7978428.1 TIGR01906 family membrane protein [Bacillus sp. WLY-B-L8]